jgi:hypothetical protein
MQSIFSSLQYVADCRICNCVGIAGKDDYEEDA